MTDRCPTCNQKLPRPITVETTAGVYIDTYRAEDDDYDKPALDRAMSRIKHLKERWGIDARIREVEE